MVCQKMTKIPIICNIPDRLVAMRVGPILAKEDGEPSALTQGEEPWGGSKDVSRTCVLAGLSGTPTTASPVFDSDPQTSHCEPCLIQLLKLSSKDKRLTLHYLENLNEFFCSPKEKGKKIFYS